MKVGLLFLFLAAISIGTAEGQSNSAPARLAIVVEDSAATVAADVLTVELSKHADLQLLERAEIEKVYHEQTLSAWNQDYVRLGQLLGADGLLMLAVRNIGTNAFLNSRLIAVKQGVILTTARFQWPLDGVTNWAHGFGSHLSRFITKLTVLAKDAVPISILSFRSAVQSSEARDLERQVALLSVDRLSRERRLFVLERRRMQLLGAEKELAGMEASPFWDGSYLLEGTIDRDGYSPQRITLNASLLPPHGGARVEIAVEGSRTNLSEVVNRLATRILETLGIRGRGEPWNPAEEAGRFFDEAKWAFRWRLYEQAEAASESAWALGKQTREVAVLRIRAYSRDALPAENPGSPCNLDAPGVPDAAKLPSAIRALELFCQFVPRISTNAATLDRERYDLGVRTLRMAARFLEGFYYTAEARPGNEERLTDLRSAARQTAALLETQRPHPVESEVPEGGWRGWVEEADCRSLQRLLWEEGGIWHEHPEDSLKDAGFLLANGYHPVALPRMVGWSWEDRKRVPGLLRKFIEGLCAAAEPRERLEGRFLALLDSPDSADDRVEDCEARLLSEIWQDRSVVLNDEKEALLLPRTAQALRDTGLYPLDPNRPLKDASFTSLLRRLQKDYLLNATNYLPGVFRVLFPGLAEYYSKAQAEEILGLMGGFTRRTGARDSGITSLMGQLRRAAGNEVVVARTPSPVWPPEKPLEVDFTPWKLKDTLTDSGLIAGITPQMDSVILREGEIWSRIEFHYANGGYPLHSQEGLVRINPLTGDCDEIPLPPQLGDWDPLFEAGGDSVFAASADQLMRYRLSQRKWVKIPVPVEGCFQIIAVSGRLYVGTSTALLEIKPDSMSAEVLASSSRRSPANEVDSLWNRKARLFARADGELGVELADRLFSFDPVARKWSEGPTIPKVLPSRAVMFVSINGVECLLDGFSMRRELMAFWNGRKKPELLLAQRNPREVKGASPDAIEGKPRWDWPEPFRLDFPFVIPDGQKVWMLQPRILPWGTWGGNPDSEPICFQDKRQATLLSFAPGRTDCLQVPLVFRKDGNPLDLFDFKHLWWGGDLTRAPFFIPTDRGMIVVCSPFVGDWFIPTTVLDSTLRPVPVTAKRPAAGARFSQRAGPGAAKPASSRSLHAPMP